jgi:type II secretory pathway component PulM
VSLTARDRKIVLALLPLLLIGVYWFMILSPKRKEATKLATQVTKAEQARDAAISQENSLERPRPASPPSTRRWCASARPSRRRWTCPA